MERLNIAKSIYGSTNNQERDKENKQIKDNRRKYRIRYFSIKK